jgi:hypothetical protein
MKEINVYSRVTTKIFRRRSGSAAVKYSKNVIVLFLAVIMLLFFIQDRISHF